MRNPSSFDLHIGYTCPNCDTEVFLFLIDARSQSTIVCNSCGNEFAINNVLNVEFIPTYKVEDTKSFVKSLTRLDIAKVFGILKAQGFTSEECNACLVKAVATQKPKNLKELIRLSIASLEG